jgi:predicted GIY-YIG superfamily endonuclease
VTQQLYRMFNADDELLYVGISMSALNRIGQHKTEKAWWHEVAKITIETHHVERDLIFEIEREAIRTECPRYNVKHARARPSTPRLHEQRFNNEPGLVVACGEVYAFGLRKSGDVVTGLVTKNDDGWIKVDLYSWATQTFGYDEDEFHIRSVGLCVRAAEISQARRELEGWAPDIGPIYDMDPLLDFADRWKRFNAR